MIEGDEGSRRDSFYERRKGHPLRAGQTGALRRGLDRLRIDLGAAPPPDLADLFDAAVDGVVLEIGFGGGEHLIHRAGTQSATGRIGVEPFVNGMAKAATAIEMAGLDNIRLFDDDAAKLLDWLPAAGLDAIDLLYPDPWPKKRHWKRRFVSMHNLDRFARVLRPGGLFRFASDIDSYVDWTLLHCRDHADFAWEAKDADDWRQPWQDWPGTRYERKAFAEGRRGTYLTFRRRSV